MLEQIYQRLGIERLSDGLSELSIEEEIEFSERICVTLKSLALLQSEFMLRKNSEYLVGEEI